MVVLSKQEFFNKTVEHLVRQGEAARTAKVGSNGANCYYRLIVGDKVLKCALGVHISDEDYNPEMENLTAIRIQELYPEVAHKIMPDPELAQRLQSVHDELRAWNAFHWPEAKGLSLTGFELLRRVAKDHQLELPPILEPLSY